MVYAVKKFYEKHKDDIFYAFAGLVMWAFMMIVVYVVSLPRSISPATFNVPILEFSEVVEGGVYDDTGNTVTSEMFRYQMKALYDAKYDTVFFDDLVAYVESGSSMSEKVVVVTLDTFNKDFETMVLPVLQEFNLKLTVLLSDCSTVRAHEHPTAESYERIMSSGLVQVICGDTTWRLNEEFELEKGTRMCRGLEYLGDGVPLCLRYRDGRHSVELDEKLREDGVKCTVVDSGGISTLVKGDIESLFELERMGVAQKTAPVTLIKMCYTGKYK